MDWKFLITTVIAAWATGVSWRALREARRASGATYALQTRLEEYEHFPIVQVTVGSDCERIKVTLTNTSSRNAVSSYKINLTLRISAGNGTFTVGKDDYVHSGGFLEPNSAHHIYPDEINECVTHALPVLNKYPLEQNNFVLRAHVECTPPHPKSKKVYDHCVGFFVYDKGCLELKSPST